MRTMSYKKTLPYKEADLVTYEVVYKVKHGKKMHRAYAGGDHNLFEETIKQLMENENIRYLATSVTSTNVILFD